MTAYFIIKYIDRLTKMNENNQQENNQTKELSQSTSSQCRLGDVPSSGYGTHYSGDFQLLNVFNTTLSRDDPPWTALPRTDYQGPKFHEIARENFIDGYMFATTNLRTFYRLNPESLKYVNREKAFAYCWDPQSDNFNMYHYTDESYRTNYPHQLLGHMIESHPMNQPKGIKNSYLKYVNQSITDPRVYVPNDLIWTPIHPNKEKNNDIIRTTDYARYVYYHEVYTRDYDQDRRKADFEKNNNIHYWYKDSMNYPSAIRPLKFSEYLTEHSKTRVKVNQSSCYRIYNSGEEQTKMFNLMNQILNHHIIVIEHRRINLTATHKETKCPILVHYLRQGWLIEENNQDGTDPLVTLFNYVFQNIQNEDTFENKYTDHGWYRSTFYNSSDKFIDNGGHSIREENIKKNKSILLVRTTLIDVRSVNLHNKDCVYIPSVDLLIGKMKNQSSDGTKFYPVDHYHHPRAKEMIYPNNDRSTHVEIIYVNEKDIDYSPIYCNTHGIVTEIKPRKDTKYSPGVYIHYIEKGVTQQVKQLKPEEFLRYGIFYSKEDAMTFNHLSDQILKLYKEAKTNQLVDLKYQYDMNMLRYQNALKQIELESKQIDIGTKLAENQLKNKELELKNDVIESTYELKKLEERLDTVDGIGKSLLGIVNTGVKFADTIVTHAPKRR